MIDEYWTWIFYGYHSDELQPHSTKPVVTQCDECSQYRIVNNKDYRDLCRRCVKLVKYLSDDTRNLLSQSHIGHTHTESTKEKMSGSMTGLKHCPITEEARQHMSAVRQGIPYEEWDGYATEHRYCEKFDEPCRERIRAKYKYTCFVCDLPQDKNITKNGKMKKLSVHHTDMNKQQGCDGVQWKLVPLCMACHSKSHYDPMKSRIDYLVRVE